MILVLVVSGCAEITKFERSDGTAYYYVDCENSMRVLETCSFAARRTCPNGYYPVKATPAMSAGIDRTYDRCIEANNESKEAGEPPGHPITKAILPVSDTDDPLAAINLNII